MRMFEDGFLVVPLDAHLQQPEVATQDLKHDHAQRKDVCLLVVPPTKQDLQAKNPKVCCGIHGALIELAQQRSTSPMYVHPLLQFLESKLNNSTCLEHH